MKGGECSAFGQDAFRFIGADQRFAQTAGDGFIGVQDDFTHMAFWVVNDRWCLSGLMTGGWFKFLAGVKLWLAVEHIIIRFA